MRPTRHSRTRSALIAVAAFHLIGGVVATEHGAGYGDEQSYDNGLGYGNAPAHPPPPPSYGYGDAPPYGYGHEAPPYGYGDPPGYEDGHGYGDPPAPAVPVTVEHTVQVPVTEYVFPLPA